MFGNTRLPSAQELQDLVELTRRDPGSQAFVDLGQAYLALGRPQDAVQVCARGLQSNPNSVSGRLTVSQAFVQMHQWKQAQAELLKVVKADRNNVNGFTLLGEVLMRRSDYERAMPVLQHAQNLDPHNAQLHDLLHRARSGLQLDPPPPMPTPRAPASAPPAGGRHGAGGFGGDAATRVAGPLAGMGGSDFGDDAATRVAGPLAGMGGPATSAPSAHTVGLNVSSSDVGGSPPAAAPSYSPPPYSPPTPAPSPAPSFGSPTAAPSYGGPPSPGPTSSPSPPPAAAKPPAPATPPKKQPKPATVNQAPGGVRPRPRVLPAEKPKDAAQASLRKSAAAGENYLNNLLMAGLLDVPSVRAPEAPFELAPGKRWGRSTKRAFIFLFVMLFASLGGGGYWYYYAEKKKNEKVLQHVEYARRLMESAVFAKLGEAIEEAEAALDEDENNKLALIVYGKALSLKVMLYGGSELLINKAENALSFSRKQVEEGDDGWRDYLIARSALTLGVLDKIEEPNTQLAEVKKNLEAWLATDASDPWATWLLGKVLQYEGDYDRALASFEQAAKTFAGQATQTEAGDKKWPVVAMISAADLHLDRGDAETASDLYDQVLRVYKQHELAVLGRVLMLSETSGDAAQIAGEFNVAFEKDRDYGPRVTAYQALALAASSYLQEEYKDFAGHLDRATGVSEPRFLARVAYAQLLQGDVAKALSLRKRIKWFGGKNPDPPPPLVTLLDAELLLISGLTEEPLKRLKNVKGVRAMRLRGRALYDQGDAEGALEEFDKVLEIAQDDLEASVWGDAARLITAKSKKDREKADKSLNKLGRAYRNLMVRYVHGNALKRIGKTRDARRKLDMSLEDITEDDPNTLAYRSYYALAELAFADNKFKQAQTYLDQSAELVTNYLPAEALKGRILMRKKKFRDAVGVLMPVVEELGAAATAELELALAEALARQRRGYGKKAQELATAAVNRAKDKNANQGELLRVAELVDPALAALLSGEGGEAP